MPREQTRERRWPYFVAQGRLALAAITILVGRALPWAVILGELLWASPLALMWSFWGGLVTLGAAVARWRWIVVLSALFGGGTAVYFSIWQTSRIVDVCGLSLDCLPGPGVGLLLAGGLAALSGVALVVRAGYR